MQLYALLKSIYYYMSGMDRVCVIYRISNDRYDTRYGIIIDKFPTVCYVRQGGNPEKNFKILTLDTVYCSQTFVVDNILLKILWIFHGVQNFCYGTSAYFFTCALVKVLIISMCIIDLKKNPNLLE